MFETSKIYIDKEKYKSNIKNVKKWISEDTIMTSVVKGNAYGHGFNTFIPMALECGINHFSVFSSAEAYSVKNIVAGKADIMIMGDMTRDSIRWAIDNNISFYIFDISTLLIALEEAKKCAKKAKIHIEVETGMNRTGILFEKLSRVSDILSENKEYLFYEGLCTHFAGAESISNMVRLEKQKKKYLKARAFMESEGLVADKYHTCCSAAAIRFPDMHFDMVRIGILQYGLWPSQESLIEQLRKPNGINENPLKRIISWKSRVMSIKKVKQGEKIGYGDSYIASKDMQLAVVPIGYADGYTRSLSNQGRALINGVRLPVVGRVNMSCITLDLYDVPNAQIGDEVVLIGQQGDMEITISAFTEISNQVNYEMLARLPKDIPREVI